MPEEQQQQQQNAPWYQGVAGVDQEIVGHWTNRGLHTKTAPEVAVEMTKAWKAAEHHVGVPADQIIRVPKDAKDEAGWNAVWARLGKPKEAKEYDLSIVKRSDGAALDEPTATFVREQAFKLNLPKEQAAALAQELVKREDTVNSAAKLEKEAKLIEQKSALKKNWGPNEAANMFVAQRAAAALQIAPETVAALEGVIGYDKIMEMFRSIGEKIGEDKFVTSGAPGGKGGPMTVEQAVAKKADLMSDKVWVAAYQAGDQAKLREMIALNTIITSGQRAA